MKYLNYAVFLISIAFFANFTVLAQETEVTVVDEVVAQVNEDVLTLSDIRREMTNFVESYVQEGKSREEAEKLVETKKAELVANLINERLVLQKAKDNISEAEIESQVNRRFLEIMKEQNIKTIEELYQVMATQGLEPDAIRLLWRRQIMREAIESDIYRRVYFEPSMKKLREYYDTNKAKFTKKETVAVSEIFLSFAGKNPDAVRQKGKELVAALRKGADFEKTVLENSERINKEETKGKAGTFEVSELDQSIAGSIKDVKAGGYSEPLELTEGIIIIRVDERSNASSESVFNEEVVRRAVATEKFPEARKKYMTELRKDAYIKISESWRAIVSPVLYADDRKPDAQGKK